MKKGSFEDLIEKSMEILKRNRVKLVVLLLLGLLPMMVMSIITYIRIPDIEIQGEKMGYQYHYVHQMTNSVIIAEDGEVWGSKRITEDRIEKMIKEFSGKDEKVVEYLRLWKEGNFDKSIEFHNYVWEVFGGDVGKANGINTSEATKVIKRLEEND